MDLAFAERASDSGGTRGVLSCNRFAILASEAEPEQEAVAGQARVPSRRVALVPQSAQGTPRSIQDVAASHFDQSRGDSDVAIEDEDMISTAAPAEPRPRRRVSRGGSKQFQCEICESS